MGRAWAASRADAIVGEKGGEEARMGSIGPDVEGKHMRGYQHAEVCDELSLSDKIVVRQTSL